MECHNYSFFQLFSFSTWEVFLHLMATFKRWFVMTAWAGVAFFKGTSLCQVKWLGLMKMVFLAMTLEAMLCKLMWEVGRCIQSCSHSDGFNWFAMVACFIVNVKENALCSTFLFDRCPQILVECGKKWKIVRKILPNSAGNSAEKSEIVRENAK